MGISGIKIFVQNKHDKSSKNPRITIDKKPFIRVAILTAAVILIASCFHKSDFVPHTFLIYIHPQN